MHMFPQQCSAESFIPRHQTYYQTMSFKRNWSRNHPCQVPLASFSMQQVLIPSSLSMFRKYKLHSCFYFLHRVTHWCQPTKDPTQRPANKTTSQPTNEPTNQHTNQPTKQPTNQPANQPSNQPTNQPTNQPND